MYNSTTIDMVVYSIYFSGNETSLKQCNYEKLTPDLEHCHYGSNDAGVVCYNETGTVFWDILVPSYFRHFGSDGFILASLIFATCILSISLHKSNIIDMRGECKGFYILLYLTSLRILSLSTCTLAHYTLI